MRVVKGFPYDPQLPFPELPVIDSSSTLLSKQIIVSANWQQVDRKIPIITTELPF
jgi:hypothetical protein